MASTAATAAPKRPAAAAAAAGSSSSSSRPTAATSTTTRARAAAAAPPPPLPLPATTTAAPTTTASTCAALLPVLDDGSADWASAFATAGARPPPPATLAIDLCPLAPRSAREASFARLAAEARREAALRADEGVLASAFAALKRGERNEDENAASIDAFRDVAVRRLGLSAGSFDRRLRRARVAATNGAAAAGLSVGGAGNNGGEGGGGEMTFAQFRAALLADG